MLDWGEEGQRTAAEISSLRAAFTQEVAVWHKLNHPNVTKVFISKFTSALSLWMDLSGFLFAHPLCNLGNLRTWKSENKKGKRNFLEIAAHRNHGVWIKSWCFCISDLLDTFRLHRYWSLDMGYSSFLGCVHDWLASLTSHVCLKGLVVCILWRSLLLLI